MCHIFTITVDYFDTYSVPFLENLEKLNEIKPDIFWSLSQYHRNLNKNKGNALGNGMFRLVPESIKELFQTTEESQIEAEKRTLQNQMLLTNSAAMKAGERP